MLKHTLYAAPLLACCLLVGCDEGKPATPAEDVQPATFGSGDPLADKAAEARKIEVIDASGLSNLRALAASQDKVLVIDCWATWCGSCVQMFPVLHQAMKERGDEVMLISLSYDEGDDTIRQAAKFLTRQRAWANAYLAKPGSDAKDEIAKTLSDEWDSGALPAVFVYGTDGKPVYEMTETRGEVGDWVAAIAKAVDGALAE